MHIEYINKYLHLNKLNQRGESYWFYRSLNYDYVYSPPSA